MSRSPRRLFAALAALSYGLAFLQRPGQTVADTRIELSADPGLFLERIAWLWSATTDFGHVQSGQFTGYLFPMGPWFAAGDAAGLPMWIVQRLWLGTLFLIAAWGVVRLMDALLGRRSAVAAGAAATVFVLNPYVVQFTTRGTVTLLAYALLPWLMVAVHRGLREPQRWRAPAVFGLLLAASGGGVNAAVIAFALLGPLALAVYELTTGGVSRRALLGFGWKAALAAALCSTWWAIPVLVQSGYGTDFLLYTEQPRTIWGTTSMSELLRLLGFWGLYTGVGFFGRLEPFMGVGATYLFNPAVIVATFVLPAFALASLRLARAWRYGPFFVLLAVLSLLLMFTGFPDGTLLRSALTDLYNGVPSVQFLRTTYKAAPLLVLSLACLFGAGVGALLARAREHKLLFAGRSVPRWSLAGLALIPLVAGLPLVTGRAIDREQAYDEIPDAWAQAVADAKSAGEGNRTMVLPGELFGWYRWGGTMDPVGPALARQPVAIREIVPYAGPRSSQLQIAVDDLVQQGRLTPGQLGPLLGLLDVDQVLVAADGRRARTGSVHPALLRESLEGQTAIGPPRESYGARSTYTPPGGRSAEPRRLPDLARHRVSEAPPPGGVRLLPAGGATVLEGDAEGIANMAGVGLLAPDRALFLAGDVSGRRLGPLLDAGSSIVLSDSARRRTFVAARLNANRGPTLGPEDPIAPDSPTFNPFPSRGSAGRTVALHSGLRRIFSPAQPGFSQFPQYRPFAAVDGRRDTSWLADENVPARDWFLQLEFTQPLPAPFVTLTPHATRYGRTVQVALSVDGGPERRVALRPGPNRIATGRSQALSLRVRVTKIAGDEDRRGAGGIAELEVPRLEADERLRLPTTLSDRLAGRNLSANPLAVVLERTSADFPQRAGTDTGEPEDRSALGMVDAESGLERELRLPAARRFSLSGWASVRPDAPDPAIDRVAGLAKGWTFRSSSRFEGVPGRRASSAFDGDPRTAWAGNLKPGRPAFIEWTAPRAVRVRGLRLRRGPAGYSFPSLVRASAAGSPVQTARVDGAGRVELSRPVVARRVRLELQAPRAKLPAVALSDIEVRGLNPPTPRRRGPLARRCGELRVEASSGTARAEVAGTLRELDAGRPLKLRGCGRRRMLALGAGDQDLSAPAGELMRPDHLALRSAAPRPRPRPQPPGRVLRVAAGGPPGAPRDASLAADQPAWLMLTQSYNRGWRARCSDRSGTERDLGAPVAIDGYANGWRVDRRCRKVRFAFAPQAVANVGFGVSALAAVVLLVVLVLGRRRPLPVFPAPGEAPADPLVRLPWLSALLVSAAIGVGGGLLFALRMGPVLALLSLALLRAGLNGRRLVLLGTACILLLPVLVMVDPAPDKGGFSFQFATEHLLAHWVAVVAVCCFAAAGMLGARGFRRARSLSYGEPE